VEGSHYLQAPDVLELQSLTDHTFTVARNCQLLQGLNITGCMKVTDDSLVTVSENCGQLKGECALVTMRAINLKL
jgi:hypothetical protein